uniref:Uncharacterized protein n=1 Tax=Anopheles quadriannulatus TaxID=34691 RepID=A0A182XDZ0_ANOQN
MGSAGRTSSFDILRLIQFFFPPSTRAKMPAFQQSNNQTIKTHYLTIIPSFERRIVL